MKWLSVKKHKPPKNRIVFIAYEDGDLEVALVEDGKFWSTLHAGYEFSDVSHFCIPDPIEIEEE